MVHLSYVRIFSSTNYWLRIPQVAVLVGELIGRYLNDWIMDISIRRNKGVHEAESRLWCVKFSLSSKTWFMSKNVPHRACYLAVVLYVSGFVMLGVSFQKKLSIGVVIIGWGISGVAIMVNTVAVCGYIFCCTDVTIVFSCHPPDAYCNDCFPKRQVSSKQFCKWDVDGFGTGWNQCSP